MKDTKTASFLIVNYNSTENINRLITEIKQNFSYPFEVLVFDNSVNFETSDKDIKVFNVGKNIGFGSAVNYLSIKSKYDYLFVLNPDIKITKSLDEVLEKFVDLPIEYAVFSLNKADKLYKTPFLGRFFDNDKRFSSNAFVVGSEYFKALGGFNNHYFMYFEDNEFAFALKKFNLKTFYPSKPYIEHLSNYNFVGGLKRKKLYYQSFLYYLKNNFKTSYFIFYIPLKIALILSKLFK